MLPSLHSVKMPSTCVLKGDAVAGVPEVAAAPGRAGTEPSPAA